MKYADEVSPNINSRNKCAVRFHPGLLLNLVRIEDVE